MSIFETIYPRKLKQGDTIGIAAPAGAFDKERFAKGVAVIEAMGFNVHVPDDIMAEKRWLAGDDTLRASVINDLFEDSAIDAILCARGGYGSVRVLNQINFDSIKKNPKLFAGFSDITALLNVISFKTGLITYHAPVVTSIVDADQETKDAFVGMLTSDTYPFPELESRYVIYKGKAAGRIAGGNLATLNHLTGTEYAPDLDGAILILEDIAEPPYKIDRMLTQMRMAGVFEGLKGIALGSFKKCGNFESLAFIFKEIFGEKNIPVLGGLKFGHGLTNLPVPIGAKAEIENNLFRLIRD